MRSNTWRTLFVAVVTVSLTACSDSPSSSGESASKVDATLNQNAGSTSTTAPDLTDVVHPPASGEFVGALVDITAHTCAQEGDGWRVTATATNPTTAAVDYRIYVSLLNGTSTTRALVETEIAGVAPGGVGTFDELIAMPDSDLRCVLRVERRSPGN